MKSPAILARDTRVVTMPIELREAGGAPVLTGVAVRYGDWSELLYGVFRERFLPGAFREHLATSPDVIATVNHAPAMLLARTAAGTLALAEDDTGVSVELTPPDTSYARDLIVSVKRGDIRGMSFMFDTDMGDVTAERWYTGDDGVRRRDVSKARLYEVSFVSTPAYPTTEAALRSLKVWDATHAARSDIRKRRLAMAARE